MNEESNEIKTPDFAGEEMKMPENTNTQEMHVEDTSVVNAPLLITLTIVLLVLLGGMYYWFGTLENEEISVQPTIERPTVEENNEPESTTAEAQTETIQTTSTSDEISAIEADVEATNLDSLDAELNAIDAELEAAIQ